MTISAKIIADSISHGNRITTFQLRYPRFIHSELLTHRVFSRNSSSSRAIPIKTIIDNIRRDPAMPIHWGRNIPGMQAKEELSSEDVVEAKSQWLTAMESAIFHVENLLRLGLHKQVSNRILEPFMHMDTILTATEFDNFYALRDHPDAQPEIQQLAKCMREAHQASTPQQTAYHVPYVTMDWDSLSIEELWNSFKVSAARCCRVSYLKHDGTNPSVEEDLKLYERLAGQNPIHASPMEHQAISIGRDSFSANFRGWRQFRNLIESGQLP